MRVINGQMIEIEVLKDFNLLGSMVTIYSVISPQNKCKITVAIKVLTSQAGN